MWCRRERIFRRRVATVGRRKIRVKRYIQVLDVYSMGVRIGGGIYVLHSWGVLDVGVDGRRFFLRKDNVRNDCWGAMTSSYLRSK